MEKLSKNKIKSKKKKKINTERQNYYDFYDDIKRGSGKVIDW